MIKINEKNDLIKQFDLFIICYSNTNNISPNTINESKQFLNNLIDKVKLKSFLLSCSEEGEINFYWYEKDLFLLDLGFKGDGLYSYYCKISNEKEIVEDGVSIYTPLPEEIVDVINYQGI